MSGRRFQWPTSPLMTFMFQMGKEGKNEEKKKEKEEDKETALGAAEFHPKFQGGKKWKVLPNRRKIQGNYRRKK